MQIDQNLIDRLNLLLEAHPASITRLISTAEHNKYIGGAPKSAHVEGKAADLIFDSVGALYAAAQAALTIGFNGIEVDTTNHHLHLDTMDRIWHVAHHGAGVEEQLGPWLARQV